jgi:predicted XRE-type DNA-binding protein
VTLTPSGLDEAEVKAMLVGLTRDAIQNRTLGNQSEAARITGLPQPDVSRLVSGTVTGFSVWRLLRILTALGIVVTMTFSLSSNGVGNVTMLRPDAR